MGVNIDCVAQRRQGDSWIIVVPKKDPRLFDGTYRDPAMFDLLAGASLKIGHPPSPFGKRRGIPEDDPFLQTLFRPLDEFDDDGMRSWLLSEELLDFDYDTPLEVLISGESGRAKYPDRSRYEPLRPGEGWKTTWREYVGAEEIDRVHSVLRELGPKDEVRLVFEFSW